MKPFRNLLFILAVFALLMLLGMVFPREGIPLGGSFELRFFHPERFFGQDTTANTYARSLVNLAGVSDDPETGVHHDFFSGNRVGIPNGSTTNQAVTESKSFESDKSQRPDALADNIRDSLIREHIDSITGVVLPIEFSEEGRERLNYFFQRAIVSSTASKPLRILHYGDSQIENDRMSAHMRFHLQKVFGGAGCGMVPAVPLYSGNPTFREAHFGEWNRFTGFGRRDTTIDHNNYGAMVCFTSVPRPVETESWPALEFDFLPGRRASAFEQIRCFLHSYADSGLIAIHLDDTRSDTIRSVSGGYQEILLADGVAAGKVRIEFNLPQGGRIYGISFDAGAGIQLDNLAMRGSSGLEFSKIDRGMLAGMLNDLNPGLILLQFGGNVVPYIANTTAYRRMFMRELNVLKALAPEIPVIVIGPADMSTREEGRFTTYPTVEPVRNALRSAALESGYAFWDMYEAMGGHNSMPTFVMADPPLATADYIHFTPRGANLLSGMFVKALLLEYTKVGE